MVDLTDNEFRSDSRVLHSLYLLAVIQLGEEVLQVVHHDLDVTSEALDEVVPFDDLLPQFWDLPFDVNILFDKRIVLFLHAI